MAEEVSPTRPWSSLAAARWVAWSARDSRKTFIERVQKELTIYTSQEGTPTSAADSHFLAHAFITVVFISFFVWIATFGWVNPLVFLAWAVGILFTSKLIFWWLARVPNGPDDTHLMEALSGNRGWVLFSLMCRYSAEYFLKMDEYDWGQRLDEAIESESFVEAFVLCLHGMNNKENTEIIRTALFTIIKSRDGSNSLLFKHDFQLLKSFCAVSLLGTYTREKRWPDHADLMLDAAFKVDEVSYAMRWILYSMDIPGFDVGHETANEYLEKLANCLKERGWRSTAQTESEEVSAFIDWFERILTPGRIIIATAPVGDASCDVVYHKENDEEAEETAPSITV